MLDEAWNDPPLILVVDDDPHTRELLEACLTAKGYRVALAEDGWEAIAKAESLIPDLILLDIMMPRLNGYEVCSRLKTGEATSAIPILVISALEQDRDKEQAVQAGADDFLTKPLDRVELLTRVRALLKVRHLTRELDRTLAYLQELEAAKQARSSPGMAVLNREPPQETQAPLILIIDDEELICKTYAAFLTAYGYRVETAGEGREALQRVQDRVPDVILLDIMMPGMSGLDLLPELQRMAPGVPVIIVTAYGSSANAIGALQRGAFDFLIKGFNAEELLHALQRAVEKGRRERENLSLLKELKVKVENLLALKEGSQPGR
jgi:DNA-binding response OmpR family regulator